jgi:hypothetical protein
MSFQFQQQFISCSSAAISNFSAVCSSFSAVNGSLSTVPHQLVIYGAASACQQWVSSCLLL